MQTRARMRMIEQLERAAERSSYLTAASDADTQALRRMVRDGEVIELEPRIFGMRSVVEEHDRLERLRHLAKALAAQHPSWVFCGPTAAALHGLDVSHAVLGKVHVASPRAIHRRQRSVVRSCRSFGRSFVLVDGLRITPVLEAAAECALDLAFPYALAIADSTMRSLGMSASEFQEQIGTLSRGRRGARRARMVARYADAAADNGGESQVRAFLIRYGYLIPRLQVVLWDPTDPNHHPIVDFYWELPDGRVILGEFDGKDKYRDQEMIRGSTTLDVMLRERQRESRLTLLGYPVLRITWNDLRHPIRLHTLLRAAGIPHDPKAEARWMKEWG